MSKTLHGLKAPAACLLLFSLFDVRTSDRLEIPSTLPQQVWAFTAEKNTVPSQPPEFPPGYDEETPLHPRYDDPDYKGPGPELFSPSDAEESDSSEGQQAPWAGNNSRKSAKQSGDESQDSAFEKRRAAGADMDSAEERMNLIREQNPDQFPGSDDGYGPSSKVPTSVQDDEADSDAEESEGSEMSHQARIVRKLSTKLISSGAENAEAEVPNVTAEDAVGAEELRRLDQDFDYAFTNCGSEKIEQWITRVKDDGVIAFAEPYSGNGSLEPRSLKSDRLKSWELAVEVATHKMSLPTRTIAIYLIRTMLSANLDAASQLHDCSDKEEEIVAKEAVQWQQHEILERMLISLTRADEQHADRRRERWPLPEEAIVGGSYSEYLAGKTGKKSKQSEDECKDSSLEKSSKLTGEIPRGKKKLPQTRDRGTTRVRFEEVVERRIGAERKKRDSTEFSTEFEETDESQDRGAIRLQTAATSSQSISSLASQLGEKSRVLEKYKQGIQTVRERAQADIEKLSEKIRAQGHGDITVRADDALAAEAGSGDANGHGSLAYSRGTSSPPADSNPASSSSGSKRVRLKKGVFKCVAFDHKCDGASTDAEFIYVPEGFMGSKTTSQSSAWDRIDRVAVQEILNAQNFPAPLDIVFACERTRNVAPAIGGWSSRVVAEYLFLLKLTQFCSIYLSIIKLCL